MTTPGHLNDGETIPYGLGLSFGEFRGLRTVSHGGAYGGYRSELLRFPDQELTVVTLCNTSGASPTLAEQVSAIQLGFASQTPAVAQVALAPEFMPGTAFGSGSPTTQQRRADQFAPFAGEYYSDELALPVTLIARDGLLIMKRRDAGELRFVPLTTDLFTTSDNMLLRIVRNAAGDVTSIMLTIGRVRDLEFDRRADNPTPDLRRR